MNRTVISRLLTASSAEQVEDQSLVVSDQHYRDALVIQYQRHLEVAYLCTQYINIRVTKVHLFICLLLSDKNQQRDFK